MKGVLPFRLLAILDAIKSQFNFWDVNSGTSGRTPQFSRGHTQRPKYRPQVPDGKWVMKYHRGRH